MTKRFKLIGDSNLEVLMQHQLELPIYDFNNKKRSRLSLNTTLNLLNSLYEENEELKQRNENQYQQLTELWEIIEEENWEKLIAMKKQLKEDEERLQKEWKCYE